MAGFRLQIGLKTTDYIMPAVPVEANVKSALTSTKDSSQLW